MGNVRIGRVPGGRQRCLQRKARSVCDDHRLKEGGERLKRGEGGGGSDGPPRRPFQEDKGQVEAAWKGVGALYPGLQGNKTEGFCWGSGWGEVEIISSEAVRLVEREGVTKKQGNWVSGG